MIHKKNIITFFFCLFAFLSTNGFGITIDAKQTHHRNHETSGNISQSSPSNDYSIISLEGILQVVIRENESNSPTFQNFNSSKKYVVANSLLQSFLFSKSYYQNYCSNRINRIRISPFYITYHRLII
ncbi:MAG: hypothetical protein A3F72_15185 [Bacteroidetes bacterium RIFCSPLOWO2_12_FULL_35_15]|nr:MAG: hypothetical protein A3F72_15185 [Bacteroidetes bacterium RIFCSPLOWO2_12_FULL_35_15]